MEVGGVRIKLVVLLVFFVWCVAICFSGGGVVLLFCLVVFLDGISSSSGVLFSFFVNVFICIVESSSIKLIFFADKKKIVNEPKPARSSLLLCFDVCFSCVFCF